jgi:hypothetical protein
MGGQFMLPASGEAREGAGITAGDQVDVDVELASLAGPPAE